MYDLQNPIVGFPWTGTGTFSGRMDPPGIAGTDKSFEFSGVEVFTFRDDRACHLDASYDLLRMLRQAAFFRGRGHPRGIDERMATSLRMLLSERASAAPDAVAIIAGHMGRRSHIAPVACVAHVLQWVCGNSWPA
jgi:hypothetical protein